MIDNRVLTQAQQGDEEAIEKIIEQYHALVYKNTKFLFLKGADRHDLLQEGYIALFKAIKSFDETKDACFSTFANICIRRHIISTIKKHNVDKHRVLNDSMASQGYCEHQEKTSYKSLNTPFSSPENILLGKELAALLKLYIAENFSQLEKNVFHWLCKQYTYIEIANILDESPKRIDNTIQRIRRKILEYLSTYSDKK